jgi:prephenate dehydrogenase
MERIAIIGLGLIGGSIALGLKRAGLTGIEIVGVARSHETCVKAKKAGAIDIEARTPAEAVQGARLVVVASPILSIAPVFDEIAPALENNAIVTDVASTKSVVARWAREKLPSTAHFVGGHPMAGKEFAGFDAADAALFDGKTWVIAPSVDAPEPAVSAIVGLAHQLGARPVFMDPDEHDSYAAAISHLPLTVASALFAVAHDSQAWPELAALASSGFRDTTRLASGSPEMAHDIVQTNRQNLLHWLDRYQQELTRFRGVIERGDSKEIDELFAKAQIERDNFIIGGPPKREQQGAEAPKVSIGEFLLGSKVSDMMKKQEDIIRGSEDRAQGPKR